MLKQFTKSELYNCTALTAALFLAALVSFESGTKLKSLTDHLATLTPFISSLGLLLLVNRKQLQLKEHIKEPLFLSLSSFSLALLLFCIFDFFDPNSLRRAVPWLFAPIVYLSAKDIKTPLVRIAAALTLAGYLVCFSGINSQVLLTHAGALLFLCLSGAVFLDVLLISLLCIVALHFYSLSGVVVSCCALVVVIPSKILRIIFSLSAFIFVYVQYDLLASVDSISSRIGFWKHALHKLSESPIFGDGPGLLYPIYHGRLLPHAHNFYISMLGEMGLVGILCLLFLFYAFASKWQQFSSSARTAILTLSIWNLFDEPFYWLLPVCVLSVLASRYSQNNQQLKASD